MKDEERSKFLDDLEEALISMIIPWFDKYCPTKIDRDGARNLIGKIGARIIFGKDLDNILIKGEK